LGGGVSEKEKQTRPNVRQGVFFMNVNKFIDWWFSGRCLKHPVVVAVIFYFIGYGVGQA